MLNIHISPRASNTFNQVAEAKRFEGVFLSRKNAEFKNQTLKKTAGTQNAMRSKIPPGQAFSQISTEMGYPIPQNLI